MLQKSTDWNGKGNCQRRSYILWNLLNIIKIKDGRGMLKQIKYKNKIYTVDYRLREFRFIEYGKMPEFIPFNSELGIKLLNINGEGD